MHYRQRAEYPILGFLRNEVAVTCMVPLVGRIGDCYEAQECDHSIPGSGSITIMVDVGNHARKLEPIDCDARGRDSVLAARLPSPAKGTQTAAVKGTSNLTPACGA